LSFEEKSLDSVSRFKYFIFDSEVQKYFWQKFVLNFNSTVFSLKTQNPMTQKPGKMADYWKKNLRTLFVLLVVWFVVSFGFGIILVEPLNRFHLGGYPLGFWFAQQGAIYSFIALIFIYVWRMNKLDREFDVHED
jgi:putative solute:sodium symporter small subunit